MAGDPIPLHYRIKQCYTIHEAVELMKIYDKGPTRHTISWVSCKTGNPVSIGYN